jgi:UDP-hydrolysing UDP-N-acetyl-D-glucosamine 2-epimerase
MYFNMKVLAFTSIRSDYDLMSPLYRLLNEDLNIDFRLIVSGAHLSKDYGYSVIQIEEDGFNVLLRIETLLSSDSPVSRVKSASLLMQNSIDIVSNFSPDLIIYAGDREDVLVYAMIGGYLNIPTIHFFSGDHVEDGYIDNPVRHAASKLSTAHFVTLDIHKKRLVRMGELPSRVFVTGNLSLDKFVSFEPMDISDIKRNFNIKNNEFNDFALLIFHPITDEIDFVDEIFENILSTLEEKRMNTFVSYPNFDTGNKKILSVIEKYKNNKNFIFYKNLERSVFMSILFKSKFMIGNSSSGICEVASLKKPSINVGLRQTGRYADKNVIFTGTNREDILKAIDLALSKSFNEGLKDLKNSYGQGNSALKAFNLIKSIDFKTMIQKFEDPLKVELL